MEQLKTYSVHLRSRTLEHRTLDRPHSGARTPGSRKSTTQLGPSPLEMVIKNFVWKYVATSTPDVPVINAFCILLICKAFAREHISLLSGHVVLWRLWGHTSDTIDVTTSDLAIYLQVFADNFRYRNKKNQ